MATRVVDLINNFADKLAREGYYIERTENNGWVLEAERTLPAPLPPAFRSLLVRYTFVDLEVTPILFFDNTGEKTEDDWQCAIFKDKFLAESLLAHGFIQFARPDTGSYDPVCFETRRRSTHGDCPLVRLDHEDALQFDRATVSEQIAPSFVEFIQQYLSLGGKP